MSILYLWTKATPNVIITKVTHTYRMMKIKLSVHPPIEVVHSDVAISSVATVSSPQLKLASKSLANNAF